LNFDYKFGFFLESLKFVLSFVDKSNIVCRPSRARRRFSMSTGKLLAVTTGLVACVIVVWFSKSIQGDEKVYEIQPQITMPGYRRDSVRAMDAYERLMDRYMGMTERNLIRIDTNLVTVVRKLETIDRKLTELSARMARIEKRLGSVGPKPPVKKRPPSEPVEKKVPREHEPSS
jgi:hypothetical protein